jgi:hypothetical protein
MQQKKWNYQIITLTSQPFSTFKFPVHSSLYQVQMNAQLADHVNQSVLPLKSTQQISMEFSIRRLQ